MRLEKRDGHLSSNSVFKDRSERACWSGKTHSITGITLWLFAVDRRGANDEVLLGKVGSGIEALLVAKEILT